MELRQIATAIGIEAYMPELDEIYATMPKTDAPACDLEVIDWLQEDYNTFGEFYELVRAVAIEVNNNDNLSAWVKTASAYAKSHIRDEVKRLPVPKPDGTVVTSMVSLYILVSMLPSGVEEYRRRGFSEKEIGFMMRRIWDGMRIVKKQTGIPGINHTYLSWQSLFAKALIFELEEGLQFEIRKFKGGATFIHNKETGEILPIINQGMVHRSGLNKLGSAGFEDAEGAFEATFTEDDENFYGHGCYDCRIDIERKAYPKSQWEMYLKPGDDVIGLHIPEGADISYDAAISQIKKGRQIVKERYPEHNSQIIYCSSWILDPALKKIVKPDSKIAKFITLFTLYPGKCDGNTVFRFAFDKKPEKIEDLPEDTSLRRGIKKMYLDGEYIHIYGGIITKV